MESSKKLQRAYRLRFNGSEEYRRNVWKILCNNIFQKYIPKDSVLLEIGSGYGEFIINIQASKKYAMDLNPDAKKYLDENIAFLNQDCSEKWNIEDNHLAIVFSSNFFEHLFEKEQVESVLSEAYRCLEPGGKIIIIGPNIRFLANQYWDFWDHNIPISDRAIKEVLKLSGFKIDLDIPKFLPYSMSNSKQLPLIFLNIYLNLKPVWFFLASNFL